MITVITTVKLIAEIALLALAGQWLLGLLAGMWDWLLLLLRA